MPFGRGQTQVLYQFLPGAVFEHDQYGFCLVTSVELRETRINQGALFDAVADLLFQWPDESFRPGFADPRNEAGRRNYVIGTPTSVRFRPFPTMLECRRCRRVYRLRDLVRRRNTHPRHCPVCDGTLGQLRYVQAHNCGRIEELYFPNPACQSHGTTFLTFQDTGRVRSARWRCGACGDAEMGRLRMTPCTCPYARRVANQPGLQYERGLKTLALTDSALFLPHTVPFINFNEDQERGLYGDPDMLALALARTWGVLDQPLPPLIQERGRRRQQGEGAVRIDEATENLVRELERLDPNSDSVRRWRQRQQEATLSPGGEVVNQVRALLDNAAPVPNSVPPRQLVEHVAVLDTLETTCVDDVHRWLTEIGDTSGAERLTHAVNYAYESLGIANLKVVDDFPIALCSAGFTRITRDPGRSVLSPFEASDTDGRTPLYVVATETEGIYLQLDARRVVAWLVDNGWFQAPAPATSEEAWAWLYRNAPGLWQHRWQPDYHQPLAIAVRSLLHTISHVLLRHVEWSGFSQSSIGEYLLPGALACVLYANRYAETKIGGLTTLFEQRLGIWLCDAAQSGRECVYDPFCTDEGGTCVGCLHREYNCPQFNRELSRAVLYGGPTPPPDAGSDIGVAFLPHGFWENVRPLMLEDGES